MFISMSAISNAVVVTSALFALSCASKPQGRASSNPATAAADLPVPHWLITGEESVRLTVSRSDAGDLSFEEADESSANVVFRLVERTPAKTILAIESRAEFPLKFDLFISPDRERYFYTSSCPTGVNLDDGFSNYEIWPQAIAAIAVGNVRQPGEARGCQ